MMSRKFKVYIIIGASFILFLSIISTSAIIYSIFFKQEPVTERYIYVPVIEYREIIIEAEVEPVVIQEAKVDDEVDIDEYNNFRSFEITLPTRDRVINGLADGLVFIVDFSNDLSANIREKLNNDN